jgi:phytoene dehydrogenase-like protein
VQTADCIIVGAGLAGLSCGQTLAAAGRRVQIIEAADQPGGRVATDAVDGFRVDRGFQVYLDAYPEGQRFLDHRALQLGCFEPGALVASGGQLLPVSDPWRRPLAAIRSVLRGTVGVTDGIRTARLRSEMIRSVRQGRVDPAVVAPGDERSTRSSLESRGFSADFIRLFFEPFFGGVFLERELATAETVFGFTFAMFSLGRACLPAGGMAAIPRQLASGLPTGSLELGTPVERIEPDHAGGGELFLADGRRLAARMIVVATDAVTAANLLPAEAGGSWQPPAFKSTTLVAFAADGQPACGRTLIVSAEPAAAGPIDNLTVPSAVAAGYAPAGQSLIYASVRGDWTGAVADLPAAIQQQAAGWLGAEVNGWRQLATVAVPRALPVETPAVRRARPVSGQLGPGLFLCGDHLTTSSINGALAAGRRVAETLLAS